MKKQSITKHDFFKDVPHFSLIKENETIDYLRYLNNIDSMN